MLEGQYIYKYLTLDKETISARTRALAHCCVTYYRVAKRIIASIERAVVIGDGLVCGGKIKSFVSVKADAKAGNVFAKLYTPNQEKVAMLLSAIAHAT